MIVGGEEHGKEQHNPWVLFQRDKEADEFGFPRRIGSSDHFRSIGTNYLVWIGHENREDDTGEAEDQESNLQIGLSVCCVPFAEIIVLT